jgi:PD-(D/E)XK nuclease superfamily
MIWSYSAARIFRQCQLQWFLKTKVANAKAKNPVRREAYLLSKLQSLWAWRGQVADQLLGTEIMKALYYRHPIHLDNLLHKARTSFALQVDFARRHRIREPRMSPVKAGAAFAAWHAIEYVEPITDAEIEMAWRDVELALRNLCAMTELWDLLWTASRCIAQRPLQFESFGVKVKAIPDLIAFYADAPPLIIDWKVHTKGSYGSRSQLALYALALARCQPHKDFPSPSHIGDPTELRLLEVQLLTGQQRFYRLCDEDIASVEDFIAASANEMLLAGGNQSSHDLDVADFALARSPEVCQRCAFRKLCWETLHNGA